MQLAGLFKTAAKRPAILFAGLAGVGVMAVMAISRGSSSSSTADAPADSSSSSTDLGVGSSDGTGSQPPYGDPWATSGSGLGFDPFSSTDPFAPGTQDSGPAMTADGCTWPPPAIPAEYTGKGSWQCDGGAWTWHWIDSPPAPGSGPGTSPGGCPLPKPTLAPALVGKYKMVCKGGKWRLEPIGSAGQGAPPPPNPKPTHHPIINVAAGRHVTYRGHRNARGQLVLDHPDHVDVRPAAHWNLGAPTNGDTTPGKVGGMVKVRKISGAPGHNGQVGRWLRVG